MLCFLITSVLRFALFPYYRRFYSAYFVTSFPFVSMVSSILQHSEAATGVKAIVTNFAIFTGKRLCWSPFLMKLQVFRSATLLKRNSNKGVFMSILRNFQEHLFRGTSANSCVYWELIGKILESTKPNGIISSKMS